MSRDEDTHTFVRRGCGLTVLVDFRRCSPFVDCAQPWALTCEPRNGFARPSLRIVVSFDGERASPLHANIPAAESSTGGAQVQRQQREQRAAATRTSERVRLRGGMVHP